MFLTSAARNNDTNYPAFQTSHSGTGPPQSSSYNIPTSSRFNRASHRQTAGNRCVADAQPVIATRDVQPASNTVHCGRLKRTGSFDRLAVEKKVKKVRLYRNGDRYFSGMPYVVPTDRYRNIESLLADLTLSVVGDCNILPAGVRYLFVAGSGRPITSIDQLEDGESYVCSTNPVYRSIDYAGIAQQSPTRCSQAVKQPRPSLSNTEVQYPSCSPDCDSVGELSSAGQGASNPVANDSERRTSAGCDLSIIRPRLVTVLRNGCRPRRTFRIVLNKRTAQTFEQVLNDISAAIRLDTGAVKKLFSIRGTQVTSLQDLFREDDVFIAYGHEKCSANDFELTEKESQNITFSAGFKYWMRQQQDRNQTLPESSSTNTNHSEFKPSQHQHARSSANASCQLEQGDSSDPQGHSSSTASGPSSVITSSTFNSSHKGDSGGASRHNYVINNGCSSPESSAVDNSATYSINTVSTPTRSPRFVDSSSMNSGVTTQVVGGRRTEERAHRRLELRTASRRIKSHLKTGKNSTSGASSSGTTDGDGASRKEPRQLRLKYRIGKIIGEGNFAFVKECTDKARKMQFALKVIDRSKCRGNEHKIENEVSILRYLRHPNIIQLIEDFHTTNHLYLVMELVTGGDLFESISAASQYTEDDASGMMFHIASAVCYLHSLSIVHRDIKPENLLVHVRQDGTKSLKLGDFGLAAFVNRPLRTVCGTLTYVAPEVLTEVGYGIKVDIWSVGVIAYILLCGFPPFSCESNNREDLIQNVIRGKFTFMSPYWDDISSPAKRLIRHLLEVDVNKRFSAKQLIEYPWVAGDETLENRTHVCDRIVQEFAPRAKKLPPGQSRQSGVAILTTTALDKGFLWSPRSSLSNFSAGSSGQCQHPQQHLEEIN